MWGACNSHLPPCFQTRVPSAHRNPCSMLQILQIFSLFFFFFSPGGDVKGLTPKRTANIPASPAHNHMKNMAGWCIDRCKRGKKKKNNKPDLASSAAKLNGEEKGRKGNNCGCVTWLHDFQRLAACREQWKCVSAPEGAALAPLQHSPASRSASQPPPQHRR